MILNSPLIFKIQSEKTSTFDDFSLCFKVSELKNLKTQLRNQKTQGKENVFLMSFQSLLD